MSPTSHRLAATTTAAGGEAIPLDTAGDLAAGHAFENRAAESQAAETNATSATQRSRSSPQDLRKMGEGIPADTVEDLSADHVFDSPQVVKSPARKRAPLADRTSPLRPQDNRRSGESIHLDAVDELSAADLPVNAPRGVMHDTIPLDTAPDLGADAVPSGSDGQSPPMHADAVEKLCDETSLDSHLAERHAARARAGSPTPASASTMRPRALSSPSRLEETSLISSVAHDTSNHKATSRTQPARACLQDGDAIPLDTAVELACEDAYSEFASPTRSDAGQFLSNLQSPDCNAGEQKFEFPAIPRHLSEGVLSGAEGVSTMYPNGDGHFVGQLFDSRVGTLESLRINTLDSLREAFWCETQRKPWFPLAMVAAAFLSLCLGISVLVAYTMPASQPHNVIPARASLRSRLAGAPPGAALATVLPSVSSIFDPARFWHMCSSAEHCGSQETMQRRWVKSPKSLATNVSDLASVPGIPDVAYGPVAKYWRLHPPHFHGRTIRLDTEIADFVRQLLAEDPFGTGDNVPYVDFKGVGEGKIVAINQRQLAFIVANVLMGNSLTEGQDGLSTALKRCSTLSSNPHGSYIFSLLSLLAVLSQELAPSHPGPLLVAMTPRAVDESWRQRLLNHTLEPPMVCVEREGSNVCSVTDFMTGGNDFQALTDSAGDSVGGGAQLCDLSNTQDESLVQFYSEVLAFAFFVGDDDGMLPVPWTLLGARRYVRDISGESSLGAPFFGSCGHISHTDWLNQAISIRKVSVPVDSISMDVHSNAFVAVSSKCSACLAGGQCSHADLVNHRCDQQRRHLDDDIGRWYRAYEPTMYHEAGRAAMRVIIRRIGAGPWGAGVWQGDSQQNFLAIWLATSLLSSRATLDYYVYERFCENPGNQCFLLGAQGCQACIKEGQSAKEGVQVSRCGAGSLRDMMIRFSGQPAEALHSALSYVGKPPMQVFDLLGGPMHTSDKAPTSVYMKK